MQTTRFRFYVEDCRNTGALRNKFETMLVNWFPMGCTVLEADGFWMGGQESSLVIEYMPEASMFDCEDAAVFAEELKRLFDQETVMYTCEPTTVKFC